MKKLLSLLLSLSLILLTTECKVSNMEPVDIKVIEDADGGKLTIYGEPSLKENVKILSPESLKNATVKGDILTIKGKTTFSNKRLGINARLSADDELRIGDILVAEIGGITGTCLQILGIVQTETSAEVETQYRFIVEPDLNDIFNTIHFVYEAKTVFNFREKVMLNGMKSDDLRGAEYEAEAKIESEMESINAITTTTEFYVQDNEFVKSTIKNKIASNNSIKLGIKGKLKVEGEKEIYTPKNTFAKTFKFVVGGVPILIGIKPTAKLFAEIEGSINANVQSEAFLSEIVTEEYEVGLVGEKPIKRRTPRVVSKTKDSSKTAFEGACKAGIDLGLDVYLYTDLFVKFTLGAKLYIGLKIEKCIEGPQGPAAKLLFGAEPYLEISLNFLTKAPFKKRKEVVSIKLTLGDGLPVKPEIEIPFFPTYTICNSPVIPEDFTISHFKEFLKSQGFPIYEGASVGIINGLYLSSPHILLKSTYSKDILDKNKLFGSIKIFFDFRVNSRIVEIYQYDNSGTIISDESTNEGVQVAGNGGDFTVIASTTGGVILNPNNTFKNYIVVSGTKNADGIRNLHYAFYRLSNTNAGAADLPESIVRIFKDSDGLASQI